MQKVPRFSHGRRIVRADGGVKRLLCYNVFSDHAFAVLCLFLVYCNVTPSAVFLCSIFRLQFSASVYITTFFCDHL